MKYEMLDDNRGSLSLVVVQLHMLSEFIRTRKFFLANRALENDAIGVLFACLYVRT